MRIVCVCNPKGGSGKSTTAVNLAAAAAAEGLRTLLVDLDLQGSATSRLSGFEDVEPENSAVAMFGGDAKAPSALAVKTQHGYDLVCSNTMLGHAEDWLRDTPNSDMYLRRLFRRDKGLQEYDVVFLDTPGNVGRLVSTAVMAATDVLIPTPPSKLSTDEIPKLFELVQAHISFRVEMQLETYESISVLLLRAKANTIAAREAYQELAEAAQSGFLRHMSTVIPEASAIMEKANDARRPVVSLKPTAPVAIGYRDALRELFEFSEESMKEGVRI